MNIYAESGDRVRFVHPENGYDGDKQLAEKYLKVGEVYTVAWTDVSGWSTDVYLREVQGIPFNSVLFDDFVAEEED